MATLIMERRDDNESRRGRSTWAILTKEHICVDFPEAALLREFARSAFPAGKKKLFSIERYEIALYVTIPIGIPKKQRKAFLAAVQEQIGA